MKQHAITPTSILSLLLIVASILSAACVSSGAVTNKMKATVGQHPGSKPSVTMVIDPGFVPTSQLIEAVTPLVQSVADEAGTLEVQLLPGRSASALKTVNFDNVANGGVFLRSESRNAAAWEADAIELSSAAISQIGQAIDAERSATPEGADVFGALNYLDKSVGEGEIGVLVTGGGVQSSDQDDMFSDAFVANADASSTPNTEIAVIPDGARVFVAGVGETPGTETSTEFTEAVAATWSSVCNRASCELVHLAELDLVIDATQSQQ